MRLLSFRRAIILIGLMCMVSLLSMGGVAANNMANPATTLHYAYQNTLFQSGLNGSGATETLIGPNNGNYVVDVDYDPTANLLFWSERSSSTEDAVKVIDLSTNGVTSLATIGDITGIDTDPVNQMVYYTASYLFFNGANFVSYNQLFRISYAGGEPELIYDAGADNILYDVAVDPIASKIYITQFAINPLLNPLYLSTIVSAGLDGSNPQTILEAADGLNGLAAMIDVDVINGALYWAAGNNIQTSATDGTGLATVHTSLGEPVGVAVDPVMSTIYYTQGTQSTDIQIASVGTNGSNPTTIATTGSGIFITGISTDSDQKAPDDTSSAVVTLGFSQASSAVAEDGLSAVDVSLNVSGDAITGTFAADITVNAGGTDTATANEDYVVPVTVEFDCSAGCANDTTQTQTLVSMLEDTVDEGDEVATFTLSNLTGPNVVAGITTHTLTINENDAAALIINTPSPPLQVSEAGNADFQISLELATQPTANVMIGINSSDTSEGTVNTANLTFTPQNWSQTQNVTIIGQDDADFDGDQMFTLTFSITSSDSAYSALPASILDVTTLDDEGISPTLVVNPDQYTATVGDTLNVPAIIGVLANDSSSNPLSAAVATPPTKGTLSLSTNGSFTYTPDLMASGTDTFTYTATDGLGISDPVQVTIRLQIPTNSVVRLYPADGQVLRTGPDWPQFTFRHQPGVEWYQVYITTADYATTHLQEWYEAATICNANDICTIPVDLWIDNGVHEWWMTTYSAAKPNFDAYWESTSFSVNFAAPTGTVNRTNPSMTLPSTLQWAYDDAALWYNLWVGTADHTTQIIFTWYEARDLCQNGVTCSLDVSRLNFPPGNYEWWVEVWGPGGTTDWVTNGVYRFSLR